ncbi:MAG: tetratricopeptide repeat protein [Prevotellaceae bacterium]|jgi:tetratricopeptide (TPR) repeat protein|nr:tetratricopeptide repeat protein [Prevotellaceae bacterium]
MKRYLFFVLCLLLLCSGAGYAQKKTFVRDYLYTASEADSKLTARSIATQQMRNELLREIGEFLLSEKTLHSQSVLVGNKEELVEDFSSKVEAISAGIVEMKILNEEWNGVTYRIEAQMTVDTSDVKKRIAEVLNDKQKTKELEESRQRTLAAEAEVERLKKELAKKNLSESRVRQLQEDYRQQVETLTAEEHFLQGYSAAESGLLEVAIEHWQKALSIDSHKANVYYNMGNAYYDMGVAHYDLGFTRQAVKYFQKAVDINPHDAAAYSNMGIACYDLGEKSRATACFQKAIDADPSYAAAYYNMGQAYRDLGNREQAATYYKKAAQLGNAKAQRQLEGLRGK